MEFKTRLKVADTVFEVISWSPAPITWISNKYQAFISSRHPNFNILLKLDKHRKHKKPKSSVSNWHDNIFSYSTKLFDVNIDFFRRQAQVFGYGYIPVASVLRFISSAVLVKKGGFLLHAATLIHKGKAYVFCGPSESGKTTIARFSPNKIILSDETTAILKEGNSWQAYATPFNGEFGQVKENASGKLKGIFFIHKGRHFKHSAIEPKRLIEKSFSNCIIDFVDYRMTNSLLNTFALLSKKITAYDLYFKPDPKLWRYIDGFVK